VAAPMTPTWPNFFVAGAPKSGTTALYEFLRQHPDIYLSPIKEPTYIGRADIAAWPWWKDVQKILEANRASLNEYLKGPMDVMHQYRMVLEEEQYLTLFRGVRNQQAIGEGSVSYFWLPSAPAAIAARVPHARMVFVLRNPAERFFSQYLAWSHGNPGRTVRDLFDTAQDPNHQFSMALKPGLYGTNLARFFEAFPREQMHFCLYEDFRANPSHALVGVFRFLGVNPDQPIQTSRVYNAPTLPRMPWLHAWRLRLLGQKGLSRFVPSSLLPFVRRVYHRSRGNIRMAAADRAMLVDYYRNEIRQAEGLIGQDLSAWRTDTARS